MIGIGAALLGSRSVRLVGGLFVAALFVVGVVEGVLWKAERRGADRVIVKINKDAEKTVEKAEKARTRADGVADPVAELRKRTCPGC